MSGATAIRNLIGGVVLSTLVSLSSAASADTAVVFPHSGDSRLASERETAYRAVLGALREQGFKVRTQTSRAARSTAELSSECGQVTCAAAMLSAASAQLAVAVAVWQAEDSTQINVTLVDPSGARYPGHAPIAARDVEGAATAALLEARSLQLLGPGPWVLVHGEPAGANVWIDGKRVGSLPFRAALSPGDHALEVQADGYAAKKSDIVIPLEPTSTARIEVALDTASAKVATSEPVYTAPVASQQPQPVDDRALIQAVEPYEHTRDSASVWSFVIGGAVAVGGVALATIQPIQTAARAGDCADASCTTEYGVSAETVVQIALGAAMVGAGVTFMIWQPIRDVSIETEVDPSRALLRARATF